MLQREMKNLHPQPRLPINPMYVVWALVIVLIGILTPPTVSKLMGRFNTISSTVAADTTATQLGSTNRDTRAQAITQLSTAANAGSAEAVSQLGAYFQRNDYLTTDALATARALAAVDSRPAYQVLIHALRANQPATRRMAAMAALEEARPAVSQLLTASLQDPDAGVREASAELIGYRHELGAAKAVAAATYDTEASVRAAAAWTLGGDLAVWSALPRMQLLGVSDSDPRVRDAAHLAEARIASNMARALGLATEDVRYVTVAQNGPYYVATDDTLYVLTDSDNWHTVSTLPAAPTALAAGGTDGQIIYLGTETNGLYKSADGGATWRAMRTGLPQAERLAVTALAIDPGADAQASQVSMTLEAALGTTELHITSLGVYYSGNGGESWTQVSDAQEATGLAIDPATPKVLYGMNETGVWQTPLP